MRKAAAIHIVEAKPRIFRDGNAWCATGPDFCDPAIDPLGCGDTPEEAYYRWHRRAMEDSAWKAREKPRFEEFAIEA